MTDATVNESHGADAFPPAGRMIVLALQHAIVVGEMVGRKPNATNYQARLLCLHARLVAGRLQVAGDHGDRHGDCAERCLGRAGRESMRYGLPPDSGSGGRFRLGNLNRRPAASEQGSCILKTEPADHRKSSRQCQSEDPSDAVHAPCGALENLALLCG